MTFWQISPVRHQEAGLALTSERTTDPDDTELNTLDLTTDRESLSVSFKILSLRI